MFDFRAQLALPNVNISLPDGRVVNSSDQGIDQILSSAIGHEVTLRGVNGDSSGIEAYWPDIEELTQRDTVTQVSLAHGTFFDAAVVHVLTTATLDCFRELYPEGRFETRRFRPNVVVQTASDEKRFAEQDWIGQTVAFGPEVRFNIMRECKRCVMTTLAQGDLPKDPGILRTVAQHNDVGLGIYASVVRGGTIRRGDRVSIE